MQSIRQLVLGITGGVAAYKAAELTRLLVRRGISVQVVMTDAAQQFITPVTMQALSGKPVFHSMWDSCIANGMPHIELSRQALAILVAPASADFIAKLAHGMADDLLTSLCLARDCCLILAPAMNKQMWEHPATQRNIRQLAEDGIVILGPDCGEQACGEHGQGRMLEPEQIVEELLQLSGLNAGLLQGKRILITAGPTQEAIDPVRVITNLSTGKMGYALAHTATLLGAEVTLISGPTNIAIPQTHHLIKVDNAAQMLAAVEQHIHGQDVFISVAAVADYKPAQASSEKIKKNGQALTLELVPTVDILSTITSRADAPMCVGFAAETNHLLAYAEKKRCDKKLALIVANQLQDALAQDHTKVTLLDAKGQHDLPRGSKNEVALQILQHIASLLVDWPV